MKVSYPAEKNTSLQNGFYPIGYYHCWHGGIHIEGVENKTPIKAIADGKIIVFRYNQELKKVKGKGGKEFFFSNNFVVIRHDYESSGKKKMTFYSLYQHLSFGSQQQKEGSKPKEQNKENIYTVKIKVFKQESGVFSSDGKSFIPLYSQVQIQSKDEVQGIYQVAFEGKNVQIPQEKNQTKTLNQSGRIVFWGDKRGDRGLLLYSEARSNTPTKGVIKDGEKVTVLDKTEVQGKDKKHTWYKVGYQGKEGFILEEHLATKPSESKETQKNDTGKTATEPNLLPKFLKSYDPKDEVVTCDIDVKAGELIGWVGKQGLFNNPSYAATHIEVFTPDDGKEFIENKQKQGDNEKFYFELKKGTELKSYLKLNFVSPPYHKGTRVKVISKTATYTKVQPIEEVSIKEPHRWTAFSDIVDGKAIEKRWLSPEKRKTFWIENEYVGLAKGKKEYVFTSSLSHIYLTDPERETQTRSKGRVYEDKLAKNVTIDIRQCKEKVSYENAEWIYVKSHYYREGKTIYNQGWVEVPKEEERFSAYHWDKFGFKTYDAENHRMYPIKGVNSYSGTSGFIKEMLALLDKNKDNKIQNEELQACYNKPELSHIFSRMVCKHKSEWSYKWAKIKSDYEKFIKYHYPDAKQTYVDERLDEIKAKYDTLYDFWDKLNFKTNTFWYFEPFAWVEQMKRVFNILPPWMKIAIEKLEMAKGVDEGQEPLFSFAKSCLEFGGSNAKPNDNTYGQWCGAFVSWCINEANYKVAEQGWQKLNSQQFIRLAEKGKVYKIIDEPVMGCIVVMSNYSKNSDKTPTSGHVTFLYGIDGNNLVCLGGNQKSTLKFSNYKKVGVSYNGGTFEQKFNCFLMPIDYPESLYSSNIPKITADEANKKFGINSKTTKNESTF